MAFSMILFVVTALFVSARSSPAPCPKRLLGCKPPFVEAQKGKDENGCPVFHCIQVSCILLGCPPGTKQIKVGTLPNGCPKYECRRLPCPSIRVPPFARVTEIKVNKYGCLELMWVSRCPPLRIFCKPPTVQTEVGKDENGCPKYECVRKCPKARCPPGTTAKGKGKDENGCPTVN